MEEVVKAIAANKPTTEWETHMIKHFSIYVKHDRFASLPLDFLVKLVDQGARMIDPNDICRLFVDTVPYNHWDSLKLLQKVCFKLVSDDRLMAMESVAFGDDEMKLPMISEIFRLRRSLDKATDCDSPRRHSFNESGTCTKCKQGKCVSHSGVHCFGDDGRCETCGRPRCAYDSLHVFNYDGHCHICGKTQLTRCEIVGCQSIPNNPNCQICGKLVKKE